MSSCDDHAECTDGTTFRSIATERQRRVTVVGTTKIGAASVRIEGSGSGGTGMRRRGRPDAGAVMLEAAFVLPVMFILLFGVIQLAFAMSTSSSATTASRTGARLASATYAEAARSGNATVLSNALSAIRIGVERDLDGRPAQATPLTLWVYRANANGDPASGSSCSSDCIKWTWSGGSFGSRTGSWSDPDACGTTIDFIGVRVALIHDVSSPFLGDVNVKKTTTMRLEPITNTAC
jgi:hypothetical protein